MAQYRAETAVEKSLTQADCFAEAFHDFVGNFVGVLCAPGEDIVNIRLVIENFCRGVCASVRNIPKAFRTTDS